MIIIEASDIAEHDNSCSNTKYISKFTFSALSKIQKLPESTILLDFG